MTDWWQSFAWSILPSPVIRRVVGSPGLSTKCIIAAALAATQSAYFLVLAEGVLARATDAEKRTRETEWMDEMTSWTNVGMGYLIKSGRV